MQLVREDWKLFRSIETLCQKAGIHPTFGGQGTRR